MLPVGALCFYQAHFDLQSIAHGASKIHAILGASFLLCILQFPFRVWEGMLPPDAFA